MYHIEKLLFYFLICVIVILILAIRFIIKYNKDILQLKSRLRHADTWSDYVHWKKELRAVYWCFLPGLSPERVKKIRQYLKYAEEQKEKDNKEDGLMEMMLPSILSICLCALCLIGTTYAWFTASVSTPVQKIEAAYFSVDITVTEVQEGIKTVNEITSSGDSTYRLETGKTYQVTLTAKGNASNGFCIIKMLDGGNQEVNTLYTQQFSPKGNEKTRITLTFVIHKAVQIKIEPVWGTSANDPNITDESPFVYGTAPDTGVKEGEQETEANPIEEADVLEQEETQQETTNQETTDQKEPEKEGTEQDTTEIDETEQEDPNLEVPDKLQEKEETEDTERIE